MAAVASLALGATPALAASATGGAGAAVSANSSQSVAPSSSSSSSSVALTRSTIKDAQRALGLKADGAIGARTRAAVRRFQRREDLPVTGRLDTATLKALDVDVTTQPTASSGTTGTAASTGSVPTPAGPAPTGDVADQLDDIAACESGGDPTAVSPSGQYHGKYQFSQATWESVGGTGDPAAAPEAEQDARAAQLLATQGPDAWPVCSKQ